MSIESFNGDKKKTIEPGSVNRSIKYIISKRYRIEFIFNREHLNERTRRIGLCGSDLKKRKIEIV